jgi:hypothetical protein
MLANVLPADKRVDVLQDHLDGTTSHVDGITGDLQFKAHQLLHPDKVKMTFWAGVWLGVQKVHSVLPPLF